MSQLYAWLAVHTLTLTRQRGDKSRPCRGTQHAHVHAHAHAGMISHVHTYLHTICTVREKHFDTLTLGISTKCIAQLPFFSKELLPFKCTTVKITVKQIFCTRNDPHKQNHPYESHMRSQDKHYGSQTIWLTDEGWQKAMPEQIELGDVCAQDSSNEQRACGGHRGARLQSTGAGTISRGGCRAARAGEGR